MDEVKDMVVKYIVLSLSFPMRVGLFP